MALSTDPKRRVLVTGASGFIGTALLDVLRGEFEVRGAVRNGGGAAEVVIGDLSAKPDWMRIVDGCSAVVHLAGPAHARVGEGILQRTITEATADLAACAARAGVRRFIYLSSIHALARCSEHPLGETAQPMPHGAYGRAKAAAEAAVLAQAGLNPVVLRSPLVHGPAARGNWARLLKLADTPLPLPFEGISNRRNVIALGSLCTAIRSVLNNSAPTGVFHLADQPALSTPDMVALLRRGLGRARRLFRLPGFAAIAPPALVESLEIDTRRFEEAFGFARIDSRQPIETGARTWKMAR